MRFIVSLLKISLREEPPSPIAQGRGGPGIPKIEAERSGRICPPGPRIEALRWIEAVRIDGFVGTVAMLWRTKEMKRFEQCLGGIREAYYAQVKVRRGGTTGIAGVSDCLPFRHSISS